jgi:hypothetical protein
MKADKALNIARGTFGSLAALAALVTFIVMGVNLDATNFPGSNLKLAEYQGEAASEAYFDEDLSGQSVAVLNGYIVESTLGCSNIVHGTGGLKSGAEDVCKASSDDATKNKVELWNSGWLVAPDCERSATDPNECAAFSANGALSYLGQATFVLLAMQTVLFAAHTCVAVKDQAMEAAEAAGQKGIGLVQLMKTSGKNVKATVGLTITWAIVGVALFIASAVAFQAMCDKIDTGLGRKVKYESVQSGVLACATTGCVTSYGSFFAQFVSAFVWFRIPYILTWFGVLETV